MNEWPRIVAIGMRLPVLEGWKWGDGVIPCGAPQVNPPWALLDCEAWYYCGITGDC